MDIKTELDELIDRMGKLPKDFLIELFDVFYFDKKDLYNDLGKLATIEKDIFCFADSTSVIMFYFLLRAVKINEKTLKFED